MLNFETFERRIRKKLSDLMNLIEENDPIVRDYSNDLFSEDFVFSAKVFMKMDRGIKNSYGNQEDLLERDLRQLNSVYKHQILIKEDGPEAADERSQEDDIWSDIDEILTEPRKNGITNLVPAIKEYRRNTGEGLKESKIAVEDRVQTLCNRGIAVTGYDSHGNRDKDPIGF